MKKNWEIKTLGEVCEVNRGSSPRPIQNFTTLESDGVNWIKIGDTKGVNKYIYSTAEKITKEGALKSRHVKEGDFILSNSMSLGKPFIMKTEGCVHDGWFILRLPEYINSDFFYYVLISEEVQNQFKNLSAGAIVKNISGDLVKKTILPIPPIKEQEEIVERLDKGFELIDSLKETAKKNLDNAKELFQSVLREELSPKEGWETKTLGEVCDFVRGLTYSKNDEVNYSNNAVLRSNNIDPISLKLNLNEIKYINDSIQIAQDKIVQEGTIMICTANGSKSHLGKVAYIDKNYGYAFGGFMGLLKPKESVIPIYLYYSLITPIYKDYISKLSDGVNINNLKFSDLSIYSIPIPPIQEQEEIVGRLDRIKGYCEELEGNYKRVLELCEELKQGLLREAFSY